MANASGVAPDAAINPGQQLTIPELRKYPVAPGDTLSALASRLIR